MAQKRKWSEAVDIGLALCKRKDIVYFYGAKGWIWNEKTKAWDPQILTDPLMDYFISAAPEHFAKYSKEEMEQIRRNSRGRIGIDCSGTTGWCTGDRQWSVGQWGNVCKYNSLKDGPAGSLLFTTWGGKGRHIGLDVGGTGDGKGYCIQAGWEATDAKMREGKAGVFISPIAETAWEQSGQTTFVDYSGVYSPYGPTADLVAEIYGKTGPSRTPKWVGMATTTVNVRTSPEIRNDRQGLPQNQLRAWPLLGPGNLVDVCDESQPGWYYVRIAGTYYGWVVSQYIKPAGPAEIKVGDRVRFTGAKIYASSYKNGKGIAVPNFDATVKDKNSQAHPFLIKSTGKDGYEGWANKDDLRLI